MDQGQKEIIRMRVVSTAFTTLALAVFKPFGLDAWHWQGYMHLACIFALGVVVCMLTDAVMKYLVRNPVSMDDSRRDVDYFIRRNLYFQIINTLLVTLMICLYRHFVMSGRIPANHLSWSNFFETLLIIAFCSFAIGLYWRFKFRSRYLAMELEETRLLNEKLKEMQEKLLKSTATVVTDANPEVHELDVSVMGEVEKPSEKSLQQAHGSAALLKELILTGTTNESVTLQISHLLYIEAVGNYVKVCHLRDGQVHNDMLRATMKQMEETLQPYPMIVRCHRAFLVNLGQVEQIVSHSGTTQLLINHCHESLPVSRSNMSQIKTAIKGL
jgi:DNA-binding LytR/AlgR family response regulator